MEGDGCKPFISPHMFQKFSYSHFSLFSNVEESNARQFTTEDLDDKVLDSPSVETQCIDETKIPQENDKQTCSGTHDPFARFTSVSSEEQKSYFKLKKMLRRGVDTLGEAETQNYNLLHSKVEKEQRTYLKLLKEFCMRNPLPYNLDAEVEKYVQELMIYCWEEPLKYSRFYTVKNLVPIVSTTRTPAKFEHLHSIVQLGQVHYLNIPTMKCLRYLTRNYTKLSLKFPLKNSSDNWLKMPISKDPNVRMLAAKYGANVVMSFGSLQTIFANNEQCLENAWEMPVIVAENDSNSGTHKDSKSKKIVFIDKPFLKTSLTVFEKNLLFQNRALREALLCPKHKWSVDFSNLDQTATFKFDKKRTPVTPIAPVATGVVQLSETRNLLEGVVDEDQCSDQSSDSEISKLFIDDCPESPKPNISTSTSNISMELKTDVRRSMRLKNKCNLKEEISKRSSPEEKTKSEAETVEPDDPSNFEKPPAGWNVSYQLLKIGNTIALVRCSVAGVSKLKLKNRFWQLAPKLEYQPNHGAQVLTFTENVHEWISTAVVPSVSLARVRINAFNSEVVGFEEVEVIPSQNQVLIKECISSTATILTKLCSLPYGNYIVNHVPNEASVNILREASEDDRANSSTVYDLHLKYLTANTSLFDRTPENVPWISIDPDVLFFRHNKTCIIPALFRLKNSTKGLQKKKSNKFSKPKPANS